MKKRPVVQARKRPKRFMGALLVFGAFLIILCGVLVVIVLPPGTRPNNGSHPNGTATESTVDLSRSNITCNQKLDCFASDRLADFLNCTSCSGNACLTSTACPDNWYCGFAYSDLCVEKNSLSCGQNADCASYFGTSNKQYCTKCVEGQCVAVKKCRSGETCDSEMRCIKEIVQPVSPQTPIAEETSPTVQPETPIVQEVQPLASEQPKAQPLPVVYPPHQKLEYFKDGNGRICKIFTSRPNATSSSDAAALAKLRDSLVAPPRSWLMNDTSVACGTWTGLVCETCCNDTEHNCVREINLSGYTTLQTKQDANIEFGNFAHLEKLNLANNRFGPELPTTLSQKLVQLNLSNNNFSGELPSSWRSASFLKEVDLSRNAMKGNLSLAAFLPDSVESIDVSRNNFECISQVSTDSELTFLNASMNSISSIVQLPPIIEVLDISMNLLDRIPASFKNAYALESVNFLGNGIFVCPAGVTSSNQPVLTECNFDFNPFHCERDGIERCRETIHPACISSSFGESSNCMLPSSQ